MSTSIHAAFLAFAFLACTSPVVAQAASFTVIGSPCTVTGEATPTIGVRGLPRVGTTFDVTYAGPNRTFDSAQTIVRPYLVTGFALVTPPFVIPTTLLRRQPAGCSLYVTPDIVLPMPMSPAGPIFGSSVSLTIPNDPQLIGARWFHQWFALFEQCGFAGCSPEWAATSDAGIVVVGT